MICDRIKEQIEDVIGLDASDAVPISSRFRSAWRAILTRQRAKK